MASFDQATNLVRVRTRKSTFKRRKKKSTHIGFEEFEEVCDDADTKRFVKAIAEALKIGDGQVLLGVGWSTKESQQYFRKYPYVLGFDVKYGSNNERRPLFRVVSKTIQNRNVPLVNCFLPSQQKYAFKWVFEKAIPECLPQKFLTMVSVMISDDDQHQLWALDIVRTLPGLIYGTSHIVKTCKWHKVRTYRASFICTYMFSYYVVVIRSDKQKLSPGGEVFCCYG